jgi:hypothetical protein
MTNEKTIELALKRCVPIWNPFPFVHNILLMVVSKKCCEEEFDIL